MELVPKKNSHKYLCGISILRTTTCFELIHMDLLGPYKIPTFDGNKYFLAVVDDFTKMTWIFLLKLKSDICMVLQQFFAFVKTQFDKSLKMVRTYNGTEFVNSVCTNMFNIQ